jgi:hypothetical protein
MKNINFDLQFGKLNILPALCFTLLVLIASGGCSNSRSQPSSRDISQKLSVIKSVCLVELENKTSYPKVADDVTESLYQSLQKKQRFSLSLLKKTDPAWNTLEVKPDSTYTLEQLMTAHKLFGKDALLIGTITSYSPYPHMAIGLQLKVVDLRTGEAVWSIQQIWDTADKATQERIKKYFEKQLHSDFSPIGEQLATLSPINFIKFVTYEVTETM